MATERVGVRIQGEDFLSGTLKGINKEFSHSIKQVEKFEKSATKSMRQIRKEAAKLKVPDMSVKSVGNGFNVSQIDNWDNTSNDKTTSVRSGKKSRISGRTVTSGLSALRGNAKGFLGMGAQMGGVGLGIGLAGAAFVGLGKHILDVTEKMAQNKRMIEATFSGTPAQVQNLTVKATALSSVFGDDYNATVSAASQLTRQFGITSDEAFGLLKNGALAGANVSGDMLQQLEQFGTQMKSLGLTASQQLALIGQSAKFGGTDTLVAGLEGFKTELSDFGSGTTALLNNAFGKDFTAKFRKNVKNGTIGMEEALGTVSQAFGKTTLSGKELEAAMQDTFGDAGSQLGIGAIKNLHTLNLSLEDAVTTNSKINAGIKEQMALDEKLAASQARLADNFKGFGAAMSGVWTNMKIGFNDALSSVSEMSKSFVESVGVFDMKNGKSTLGELKQKADADLMILDKVKEGFAKYDQLVKAKGEAFADETLTKSIGKEQLTALKAQRKFLGIEPSATDNQAKEITGKKNKTDFFAGSSGGKSKGSNSLESGINNIVSGGKETRNVTVNVAKIIGIENMVSTVKEAAPEVQKVVLEELMRMIQNAELMLAK